jgi:hypothetical protein
MKFGMEALEGRRLLSAVTPVISEILAGNKTGLRDGHLRGQQEPD